MPTMAVQIWTLRRNLVVPTVGNKCYDTLVSSTMVSP